MIFDSQYEKMLVEEGFNSMSMENKNNLITALAKKNNLVYSEVTDEYILNHTKNLKTQVLNENCDDAVLLGFKASNGHTYRTNRDDQLNMIGQMVEIQMDNSITQVFWKTEDAGYMSHPKDEWVAIFRQGLNHKRYQLFKYDAIKAKLNEAKTHAEVHAIDWSMDVELEFPVGPSITE